MGAMTHALSAAYEPGSHPHVPAGSSSGGQFAPTGGGNSSKAAPPPKKTGHPAAHRPAQRDSGTLTYDAGSNHGTGYDSKDGDPRVHRLQQALNRLGLTDSTGKPLKDDGKLGPKTTAAVKKAQHRLGLPADGKVTPALLDRLAAAKTLPAKKAVHAAGDPQKPYGDVGYADPGYQADGVKRYPLDSEEHCRAAWSYINQADNAAKYTADQLAQIKARIKAAGEKYGITFAEDVKAAAGSDLLGVELARPGAWKVAKGDGKFTAQDLRDAADFFAASGGQAVPVKLGHFDDRWDGEPTFGNVTNVRYTEDDRGPVLLGDITGMPQWLAASAPTRWPNRSIEGFRNVEYDGREYGLVLSGLAFLGATPPAIRNIKSLADLQTALAASSAQPVFASAPDDDPATPPHAPAPVAEEPIDSEEAGMSLAKYREALAGLPDDASEEDVAGALSAAGFVAAKAADPPPGVDPGSQPEPEKELVRASGAPGTVVLASSVWEETQNTIKRLTAFVDKTQRDERDQVIAKAVQDGKFTPAQRTHFARLWDADPTGTRALIDNLTRNSALAVMASGYAGDGDESEMDREFAHLFPPREASRG